MGNEVVIEIIAEDQASPTVERAAALQQKYVQSMQNSGVILDQYGRTVRSTTNELGGQNEATRKTTERSNALENQWNKLTSGTDFLAGGVKRLRGMLEGILWGTIIGAIAGMVAKLTEWALRTEDVTKKHGSLVNSLDSVANQLDPLRTKTEQYTKSQFNLMTATFQLEKIMAQFEIIKLTRDLADAERVASRNTTIMEKLGIAFKMVGDYFTGHDKEIDRYEETVAKAGGQAGVLRAQLNSLQAILKIQIPTWDDYTGKLTAAGGAYGATNEQEKKGLAIAITLAAAYQIVNGAIKDNVLLQENLFKVKKFLIDLGTQEAEQALTGDAAWQIRMRNLEQERNAIQAISTERRQMLDQINAEIVMIEALGGAYGPILQQYVLENMGLQFGLALRQASVSAIQQYILGQQSLGAALKQALAQTLAQIAAESAVKAILAAATGFYYLAIGNAPGAAAAFKAAGLFTAAAGAAGAAAHSLAASGGSGGAAPLTDAQLLGQMRQDREEQARRDRLNQQLDTEMGVSSSSTLRVSGTGSVASGGSPPLHVQIIINGNVIGEERWVHDNLIPQIEQAVQNRQIDLSVNTR